MTAVPIGRDSYMPCAHATSPAIQRLKATPCRTPHKPAYVTINPWTITSRSANTASTVLYEPAEEGGYVVTCPALPGLVTEGETLEEARQMARDAIRAYLESLKKDGMPIPTDKKLALDPVELDPVREELRVPIPT
jgi:antitoxin HicB